MSGPGLCKASEDQKKPKSDTLKSEAPMTTAKPLIYKQPVVQGLIRADTTRNSEVEILAVMGVILGP